MIQIDRVYISSCNKWGFKLSEYCSHSIKPIHQYFPVSEQSYFLTISLKEKEIKHLVTKTELDNILLFLSGN